MKSAISEVKATEVPYEVLDSSSSSVHVRKDYQSPSGNINPDLHHSVDAKSVYCFHKEAKSPPELTERKPRLKLPATLDGWKKINEELEVALPLVFPDLTRKRMTCSELDAKFHRYLYDFIAQRVPQKEEKKKANSSKTRNVLRTEAALKKNRKQKLHHKRSVKILKSAGCFCGELAKDMTRLWRKLLRIGSRLRRGLKRAVEQGKQRRANTRFRANPHDFAKKLFKPPSEKSNTRPTKERCEQYFPNLYSDPYRQETFDPTTGMKRPSKPTVPLALGPPNRREFRRAVWSKRNAACPGRNGINYVVFKRLPAAFDFLYLIVRKAWNGDIPDTWAQAAVILLFKGDDPADPANYRPIALQSCSGKIYFTLWAKRLEEFMKHNNYFKRSKQKGFLQGVAGCSEHIAALKAALRDSKSSYRQIVVAWIDLKNAFGSVSHNLIQFALEWYHVPAHLANIIFVYYEMLFATIEEGDWSSRCFTYEIGVFQGCVISPLLFNIVFNLLLDLLSPLTEERGYRLKDSKVTIHDLAYADDLSLVARSVSKAQMSLDLTDRFLAWSRTMAAKPGKCRSLALKYWSSADVRAGRTRLLQHAYAPYDPELKISGAPIKFIAHDSFKFLGWEVYHHLGEAKQKEAVRKVFQEHLDLVDKCDLHGFMKLWLYQHYVVAFLAWPLMVYDLDVSWVSGLEKIANRFLKRWAGLYRHALVSILYRPREQFGLQLTSLVCFYKRLQIGQAFLSKYSADGTLNSIYASVLAHDDSLERIWRPAPELELLELQVEHERKFNGQSDRCGLGSVPGRYTRNLQVSDRKCRVLNALTASFFKTLYLRDVDKAMQGCYQSFKDVEPFDLSWRHLIGTRNPRLITWVLNASINSVVTPDLRRLWGFTSSANCPLCGHHQASLFHILVGCRVALEQLRYSWRHDSVLATLEWALRRRVEMHNASPFTETPRVIEFHTAGGRDKRVQRKSRTLQSGSPLLGSATDWKIQIDYTKQPVPFPVHICVTDQRPDVVLFSGNQQTVILIELTCPAEENIASARLRKSVKYTPLKRQIIDNGWKCHLWTIEVGARGFVAGSVRRCLRNLGFRNTEVRSLIRNVSVCVSRCSFGIYKSLRVAHWKWAPLVRIGTRPAQPSELSRPSQEVHAPADSEHDPPSAVLTSLPSSSRPQPVASDSKHDAPRFASTSSITAPSKSVRWATGAVSDAPRNRKLNAMGFEDVNVE